MRATVAEKREVAKGTLFVLFAVEDYPEAQQRLDQLRKKLAEG